MCPVKQSKCCTVLQIILLRDNLTHNYVWVKKNNLSLETEKCSDEDDHELLRHLIFLNYTTMYL